MEPRFGSIGFIDMDYRERHRSRIYTFLYVLIALIIIGGAAWLLVPQFKAEAASREAARKAAQMSVESDESSLSRETLSKTSEKSEPSIDVVKPQPEQSVREVSVPEVAEPVEPEIAPSLEPVAPQQPEIATEPVMPVEETEETTIPQEVVVAEVAVEEGELRIPRPPTMLQSYIEEAIDWSSSSSGDFFSDFFVSGSDMIYEDGIQNPYLYINDEYYGSIEVDMRSNSPYISSKALSTLLLSLLEKNFYDSFFSSEEEFYGMEYFTEHGVVFSFDANAFAIYLSFSADQLPETSISLSSGGYTLSRTSSIEGVQDIEPAGFSFASNLSAYGYLNYDATGIKSKMLQLSMSNMMSFCDLATDFSLSVSGNGLNFGSMQSYFDFIDDSIRVTVGTVPVYSALESSNPLGFSIEKNYSYGSKSRMTNQFQQEIVIDEDCTVIVFMNGVETFRRSMKVGQYKLRDFAFVQGSNKIEIWQVPVGVDAIYENPDERIKISYFDMGFDSSLLAKGENLWKFTYSFPSVIDTGAFPGFHYVDFNGDRMVAKFSDFSASWEQALGLTHTFTLSNVAALSGSRSTDGRYFMRVLDSFNMTKAFSYGTLTLNGQLQFLSIPFDSPFNWDSDFKYSFSLTNKFNNPILSPIALSLSYDSYSQRLSLATGYGRNFSWFRGSLSGSFGYDFKNREFSWNASLSLSATFGQGLSLSGGITTSSTLVEETIPFKVSIGLSMVLGSAGSVSAKSDINTIDAGLSLKPFGSKKSNIQVNINGIDVADLLKHTLAASYSYSGDLAGISVRQQFTNRYKTYTTTLSLNTAFAFADGHFGLSRNVSGSYLLVHPTGLMKKSSISIGKATASSSTVYPKLFGNVLYSGLSLYQHNGVVVFGSDSSMFGTGGTFLIGMTPRPRQGFVKVLSITPTVTMSAVLKKASGEPFVQYSSPVYRVLKEEVDGNIQYSLEMTQDYLFTDDNGRFIQSNLTPGLYCIDLDATNEGDSVKTWYGVFFEVPELDESSQVIILEDYQVGDKTVEQVDIAHDIYAKSLKISELTRQDEQTFWDTIFLADTENAEWNDFAEEELTSFDVAVPPLSEDENSVVYTPMENVAP